MNNAYKILTKSEVHHLFQNAYQRYHALAVDYYKTYQDQINIPYSDKFIKLLTSVIILCNRFSINTTEQLYNIINLENLEEAENYFSHIKAYVNKINHQLKHVEEKGGKLRKEYRWQFPSIFDNSHRVYVKINPILPEKLLIEEALSYLNFLGVENLSLITEEKTLTQKGAQGIPENHLVNQYWIKRGNQSIKVGRFFKSLVSQTEKLIFFFQSGNETKDILPFLELLSKNEVKDIPSLLKKETTLPAGRIDLIILSYLKKTDAKNQEELINALRLFFYRQKDILDQLQTMQTKNIPLNQIDQSIDTILFSINKRDLSTISTFTSWRSCMSVGGLYFDDIANQIGAGSIVAYGLNSQSPDIRIARLMLKPYIPMESVELQEDFLHKKEPSKSDTNTFLPNRVYMADQIFGLQNDRFKLVAESFAKDHLNTPNVSGAFFQAGPFHLSNLFVRYLIYDEKNEDNLIDYLKHNKISYQTLEDGSLYLPRLSIKDTDQINLKNLSTDHLLVEGDLIARGGIKGPVSTYKLSVCHASNILKFPDNLSFHYLKIIDPKLTFLPQKIPAHVLDITGTGVRSLPTFLTVHELIVKGTPIQSIPYLPTLKKLDISYSKNIRTITAPLQLDKLEAAYCENLTEISNDVKIKELLDVRQTAITKLPKDLSVQTINIYNCKNLTSLPKEACFQTLYASFSGLKELPAHLNCNTLLLNDTRIEQIPAHLTAKKVNLTGTLIQNIPSDLKVQELYLDQTKVQVVPAHIKVQKLSLFNCPVQTIHYSKHLKSIYLSKPVLYIHPKIDPKIIEGIDIKSIKQAQKNYVSHYQKNKENTTV